LDEEFDISLRQRGAAGVRLGSDGADAAEVTLRLPAVLWNGNRIPVPSTGLTIGRDRDCDLTLLSGLVSRHHARIAPADDGYRITDLGSRTGIYLNGEHFLGGSRLLNSGDSFAIADEILYFVTRSDAALPAIEVAHAHSALRMDRPRLTIGSAGDSDIVLDHPTVSPHHAEILIGPSGARIKDLSQGGAGVRINGQLVARAFLKTGDEIAIGPYRFVFDGALLQQRATGTGMRLDAEAVCFSVGDKMILQSTSLTVLPGELIAIIGESGAGKSTLMKVLSGVHQATSGRVTLDGEPVHTRLDDLGYVPQDEIVHRLLTVREALSYAARLRLPLDSRAADRAAVVDRVLAEVGLSHRADTRIDHLSGGQRKRVGVASELISQPGMLFLDEPTTGLDPGLERRLMTLFRSLADGGRATVLVTHATRSLRLCDKVVVMGAGGVLCFEGSPDDALGFFGAEDFDDLYEILETDGVAHWHARFAQERSVVWESVPIVATGGRVRPPRPFLPQLAILVRRYGTLVLRDRRNLLILGLQVPLLAVLTALLFNSEVFVHSDPRHMFAGQSAQLLFIMITICIWFGSIASAREIIKERAVVLRETTVGVRVPVYLASKATVLFTIAGLQTVLLAAIVFALRPLHESDGTSAALVLLLVATSWVGVGMGLVVSVCVRSEDQAGSFIPLVLVPQLLFGGALVPVAQMGLVLKVISRVVVAQWSFAGAGSVIHMQQRIDMDAGFRRVSRFGDSFFTQPPAAVYLALLAFLLVFAALLIWRLPRFANAGA
jgi:ABC-type multidrug transport system ATPase subunit/pSer/pThr/pTyr-binding forkhead associated (FHA) protein